MKTLLKSLCLTTVVLFSFCMTSYGQVYKFKSTALSMQTKINEYRWSAWDAWEETSVLITVDINKERITIYSKEIQIYDIANYEGETTDNDGDTTISFYCVDKDGKTCRIRLVKLISQDDTKQLYVDYSDARLVYNVYSLD